MQLQRNQKQKWIIKWGKKKKKSREHNSVYNMLFFTLKKTEMGLYVCVFIIRTLVLYIRLRLITYAAGGNQVGRGLE